MNAADASVAVAAAQPWHGAFSVADAVLRSGPVGIPAHAAIETYSVLSRFPAPARSSPADALAYVRGTFQQPFLALPASEHERLLEVASSKDISGGAIYDALVGASAAYAGATLLTLDRRAVRAYEAVGVDFRLLA